MGGLDRVCYVWGPSANTALETSRQVNDADEHFANTVAGCSRHRALQGRRVAKLVEFRADDEMVDAKGHLYKDGVLETLGPPMRAGRLHQTTTIPRRIRVGPLLQGVLHNRRSRT